MREGVPYEIVKQGSEKIKEYMDLFYEHEDINGRIDGLEKKIKDKQSSIFERFVYIEKMSYHAELVYYGGMTQKEFTENILASCDMQDLLIAEQDIKALIELQLDFQKWKYKLAEVRNNIHSRGWDNYL